MQTILVTGATGFLGKHLVAGLQDAGFRVRALVRNAQNRVLDFHPDVEIADGDVTDILSLEKALEGVDQVLHAAAVVSFWRKRREEMNLINVQGTAQVVDACIEAGISRLVHISSVGVFGRNIKGAVNEQTVTRPGKGHSFYGKSKYLAEIEVQRGVAEGLDAVILNPAVILGKGDWTMGPPKIFSVVNNGLRFYNQGTTGLVAVEDVVAAVILALQGKLPSGERFLLVADSLPQKDFLGLIAQGLHKSPPSIALPKWLTLLVGRISEGIANLTGKEPVISLETMRSSVRKSQYDGSKITVYDGFSYTPVHESIERTAAAFLQDHSH